MTTAQLVFLYTAEELNISKAAKRAFVSQQCASSHIKNLEKHYGISLFARKPALALTPAGQSLYEAYQQLFSLEQNTENIMTEIRTGSVGTLRVGMNSTRSRILIPSILTNYIREFPKVQVDFQFEDTLLLVKRLQSGKLDLVIGIGTHADEFANLKVTPISKDSIHFLTTSAQIRAFHPDMLQRVQERRVALSELARFPFCRNNKGSTLTKLIDRHLYDAGVSLDNRYYISDYDTQLLLCANNVTSCFCPYMVLKRVHELNGCMPPENRILDFTVAEITDTLSIDLIQMKYAFQPHYVKQFIRYLNETIQHMQNNILLYSGGRRGAAEKCAAADGGVTA